MDGGVLPPGAEVVSLAVARRLQKIPSNFALLIEGSNRLEKGRFGRPAAASGKVKVVLSQEKLAMLLGGIELAGSKGRAWFRRVAGEKTETTSTS